MTETTASALAFAIYELSQNPSIEVRYPIFDLIVTKISNFRFDCYLTQSMDNSIHSFQVHTLS